MEKDLQKVIPLNIVMTYPVNWGKYQVIRDFVQNFYDSVGYEKWKEKFRYEYLNDELSMWVDDITFSYEWLLHIGASTKTSYSQKYAGYFGEGFKIASLCAKRDYHWEINMRSADWSLDVDFIDEYIDNTLIKMMAFILNTVHHSNMSKLTLSNFSEYDYRIFVEVLDSFYYPQNILMGKVIWADDRGAVYLRSKEEIPSHLPCVYDYGRKGAVFCAYQMLGTNPFDLVVCLHQYKKSDRERKTLYRSEVIDVFEYVARLIDSEGAMLMLEKMRRYWNSVPRKKYDIHSWSNVINLLIYKIKKSEVITNNFIKKYPNLLYLDKVMTVAQQNRRKQAKIWLNHQEQKYVLVKDTFESLGYNSVEQLCELNGGFTQKVNANDIECQCFVILENICRKIFYNFFVIDDVWPEWNIILNERAICHGMAVVVKKKKKEINDFGNVIKNDILEIHLKRSIFSMEGFYDALTTYVHEMCHMFGGDSSDSFSLALTKAMEILMLNHDVILQGHAKWKSLFAAE